MELYAGFTRKVFLVGTLTLVVSLGVVSPVLAVESGLQGAPSFFTPNTATPTFVHTIAYTPYHIHLVPFGESQSAYQPLLVKSKKKDEEDEDRKKSKKEDDNLEALILMLKDQISMVKNQLRTLQTTVDNLPNGAGDGHHTLRWDRILDSTNGDPEGCNSDRFKCIFPTASNPTGEAVLDLETGLVWERAPGERYPPLDGVVEDRDQEPWWPAVQHCIERVIGGTEGWRLPSVMELKSLVDSKNRNPALPTSHPFRNIQSSGYWSATSVAYNPPAAWNVFFNDGDVVSDSKSDTRFGWCVRGPMNADTY